MSTPSSAYFRPQPELHQTSHEATRDRSGSVLTPFWTIEHGPSTERTRELANTYAHPHPSPILSYVDDERMPEDHYALRNGVASTPTTLQSSSQQHAVSRSAGGHRDVQASPVDPSCPGRQVRHFPDADVRSFDRCSRPTSTPFGTNPGLQHVDVTSRAVARQAWDNMIGTVHVPPTPSFAPSLVRAWEASGSEPNDDDRATVEPAPLYHVAGDETAPISCCEWTDERGTCNMDVIGDRVWMSHHLSRVHDVVGHEKTPRACLWRGCADVMTKGSLARHVVSRHLRAGASCGFCSKVYSRADVARRHTKKCKAANEVMGEQAKDQAEG